ncbi:MAG: HD domain-containing protein [Spirochaetales bacterium]|nr:HD domain-containing protein [Spirochaetales bacterium]
MPDQNRFEKQLDFIGEIDKVKEIYRQTYLVSGSRKENDAEHSWHLAVMAALFSEYAPAGTDMVKVVKMVLIHDLVEIDAGDTYLFDEVGTRDKAERETKAAERIFGILPEDQNREFHEYWREFEDGKTSEAKFALVMDRFQPFYHNWMTRGISWIEHDVKRSQVLSRMEPALKDYPPFYNYMIEKVEEAVKSGWLLPS